MLQPNTLGLQTPSLGRYSFHLESRRSAAGRNHSHPVRSPLQKLKLVRYQRKN